MPEEIVIRLGSPADNRRAPETCGSRHDSGLLQGLVLSVLPGTVARLTVVVTISAGAAATAVGLLILEDAFDRGSEEESLKEETRLG